MPSAPKERDVRSERVQARISPDTKRLLERAASLRGVSLSDFVVSSAYDAATRTVKDHQVIALSARDSEAFALALLSPPAPNDALKRARKRYTRKVQR